MKHMLCSCAHETHMLHTAYVYFLRTCAHGSATHMKIQTGEGEKKLLAATPSSRNLIGD